MDILTALSALAENDTSWPKMDDDGLSLCDTPGDPVDPSLDQQKFVLQSYTDSLPYACESEEVMLARLEAIVAKIYICAKSQNWLVLTTWDGMLQWYTSF